MNKQNKREINGILLLDKPKGLTSNAALQKVKRLLNALKAGHTGSLDPLATGMLALCFGEATKFSPYLLEADKHYLTTMRLGIRTTTGDADGELLEERPIGDISDAMIEEALAQFRGAIEQIPSMYSAIKHEGQPLYKLARQGKEVKRKPRPVTIRSLIMLGRPLATDIDLDIHCTKGTYVRTLVEDIGEALGCGAHVVALRRLSVGTCYNPSQMVTLETLESLLTGPDANPSAADKYILPIDTVVRDFPDLAISEAGLFYLMRGQAVDLPYAPGEGWLRLYAKTGAFLGIGEVLEDGRVAPRRLVRKVCL